MLSRVALLGEVRSPREFIYILKLGSPSAGSLIRHSAVCAFGRPARNRREVSPGGDRVCALDLSESKHRNSAVRAKDVVIDPSARF